MKLDPKWEFVSDQVMGGVSRGQVTRHEDEAGQVTTLTGQVSLENNGGFVQMAFDLPPSAEPSQWKGIVIEVRGNSQSYELRLRTTGLSRPWQSYRATFDAMPDWQQVRFPYEDFEPHRTEVSFDPAGLLRIGILAIGREFDADVSVRSVAFYK